MDFGIAMTKTDFSPSRHKLSIDLACDYVIQYCANALHTGLSIIGMLDETAVTVSRRSMNPQHYIKALRAWRSKECRGGASLQNALDLARVKLFDASRVGSKEIVVIFGGLMTCDPGDIRETIASLVKDRICVKIIGFAAPLAICREKVRHRNAGNVTGYDITLDESHLEEMLMQVANRRILVMRSP